MNRIKELENLILYHKALYYQGRPEISDVEFDILEEELKILDSGSEVLNVVGTQAFNNKELHDRPMLSLAKTYDVDNLIKWIDNRECVSCLKIDGISCSVLYKQGKMVISKTRGDGISGENISEKVKWMKSIPKQIKDEKDFEVRGELFITKDNFEKLSKEMIGIGIEAPSSQRNIVAGLISRKENVELSRYIDFLAFDYIEENTSLNLESEKNQRLTEIGFNAVELKKVSSTEEVLDSIEQTKLFMGNGDFQIDGVVFALNDLKLHNELGETSHHPKYKMAFKFAGESKTTLINSITWQVSRNGILTPVASVEPVELSGAMISRVTLHNWGVVRDHKLKKGDTIEIVRSGEVIPKLLKVVVSVNAKFEGHPEICPACGEKIKEEDIRILCVNEMCPGKIKEEILFFLKNIGIENISEKRLMQLIESKVVQNISDIYRLNKTSLLTLEKVKEKLADKLLKSIDLSKNVDLLKFVTALGISGGAKNKCQKVIDAGFFSLDKFKKISQEELIRVEGFAEKSAKDFVSSLQSKYPLIDELISAGVEIKDAVNDINSKDFEGMQFCITGTLSRPRKEIEKFIISNAGKVSSSVSKKTTYLVTNEVDSSSSKYKKAKSIGIKIITEDDLFTMVTD